MIHYHGTPMTPVGDMVKSFAARHAMVSFANPEQMEICAEICQSVVLDNGAFTAWKQGKPHDFQGYVGWCRKWLKHPAVEWAVIPDVIDGDEEANDDHLLWWPFPLHCSVPVYHMHESLERLERLAAEYPRIALGSSGEYAVIGNDAWWTRMADMMNIVCDKDGCPKAKLHGLRMLDPGVFSKLPFASADSTNVARNVGMDTRWKGTYITQSRAVRALILMDRIERHASAAYWSREAIDQYQNMELLG